MLNKIIGTTVMLFTAIATAAPPIVSSEAISKEKWLGKLKDIAPVMLCKSFTENADVNKLMLTANINYDKCLTLMPASFDKCRSQYDASIPASIDDVNAAKWGNTLGKCIGTDFAASNFKHSPKSISAKKVSKELWLNELTALGPKIMCVSLLSDKSTQKKLKKFKIDNDKCLTLIPASLEKCKAKFDPGMPATLDKAMGDKWAKKISHCVGEDFAKQHLM